MEGYFDSFAILAAFTVGVFVLLLIDLVVLSGKDHHVGMREATLLTIFWTLVAAAVGIWVFIAGGNELGIEYATAYVAERALSIDNLFVFLVIFNYFALPDLFRSRALLFGIVGALIARAVFIFFAIGIIDLFEPILYLLAAILIYTAYKLITAHDEEADPSKGIVVRGFRKLFQVSDYFDGHKFFTVKNGVRAATPFRARRHRPRHNRRRVRHRFDTYGSWHQQEPVHNLVIQRHGGAWHEAIILPTRRTRQPLPFPFVRSGCHPRLHWRQDHRRNRFP